MRYYTARNRTDKLRPSVIPAAWLLVLALFLFFHGYARAANIMLAWDAESGAAGYKIYYGVKSDTYTTSLDVGNVTTYALALADGQTYYLAATAYDAGKLESDYSNEISYTAGAASCPYTLSPTSATVGASGGSGSVTVTTQTGCSWTASPGASWVTITSGSSGTGSGTVAYTVAANTGSSRVAASTIAGKTFTLTQAGVSTYTVTASAGTGGSISPAGSVGVASGGSQSFTITPTAGYTVSSVAVDGTSVGAVTSYTFSNVAGNHTITAAFAAVQTYTVTSSAGTGGSISPSGKVSVMSGGSITFTITPNSGRQIRYLAVDGKTVSAASSYTFTGVKANHTIKAYFR